MNLVCFYIIAFGCRQPSTCQIASVLWTSLNFQRENLLYISVRFMKVAKCSFKYNKRISMVRAKFRSLA